LPDLEIREHHGVADRHAGKEIGVALGPHEMNALRQILWMLDQQIAHRAVNGDRNRRRGPLAIG
jgi:hypothetical protein